MIGKVSRFKFLILSYEPAIIATASPRKLTFFFAKTGWSANGGITPKIFFPGISFSVKTISIPWFFSIQSSKLPIVNDALLNGDLKTLISKEFSGEKSSPNISVPSNFFSPSILSILFPTSFMLLEEVFLFSVILLTFITALIIF